ncbi:MAG: sulfite reductase subunit alpha [Acidobacteriaceae bacterium]
MNPTVPFIPDDAPFTPEQRSWLNGFLAGVYSTVEAPLAKTSAPALNIAILFATQSGTSERLAKKLAKELKQQGHAPELASLDTYTTASLAEQTHALVLASTYGEGDPPDGAQAFAESLHLLSAPRLDNLRYAVFALGDTSYEHFCKFGADLDARFYALGGTRLCDRVDSGVDVDEPFDQWKSTVLASLSAPPSLSVSASIAQPGSAPAKPHTHTRENPYLAEVIDKRHLTHEVSSKLTVHVGISLAGSEVHYEAGDACGVIAQNDPAVVEEILTRTNFSPEEIITLPKLGATTLLEALTHHLQPSRLTRKTVQAYAALGDCRRLEHLLSAEAHKELDAYMYDRGLIDLIEECPGLLTSPAQLIDILPKLSTRLYSISSSPAFHSGELHTTVAVVRYHAHNRDRGGVCSTMLSERTPLGARVPIYIQPNKKFRLPADPAAPIIMIGPGTGIAPFRSFLHERRALGATGRNWLFFGDRSARTDFLYRDELEAMCHDGHLTRLDTAFSRDQEHKVYVQDRMVEFGAEFWKWLNDGASLYVCGDASRMAKDVDAALHRLIEEHGSKDSEAAQEFVQELQEQNRYHRDVY